MEKNFGIKDLFLFLLIGALIVVVVLAMRQFDRQYQDVRIIKEQQAGVINDLAKIRRQLAEGVTAIGAGPGIAPTTQPKVDAFTALREAEKQPDFARGDWLIQNFATKIGKLTPIASTDIYQRWVEVQVLETLVDRDPNSLEYVPRLASHWEVSPDGLRMRFFLRRGVEFSDGEPLTADDVIFTFNWIRNPAVQADRERSYLTKLKDVKKIDDYTVEFTFSEFYFLSFGVVGQQSILAEHFYSKYTPDQFNEKTGLLMGSGPYKMEDPAGWTPGQPVQIVRNARYWGVPPAFDRIRFNELQGEATEMVVFGNQEQDIIRCTPEQYHKLTSDPRIMAFADKYEYADMYRGYSFVGWNQVVKSGGKETPSRFADKRVRQAMTSLLDRERIVRDIYLGYGVVASGPYMAGGPQADPQIKPWPYDEARGKSLLAAAGYADRNGDGVIEGADGRPFRFTLTYPSGNETTEKIVLLMKDNYARAGIVMDPDRVDWPVLINKLNAGDFDGIALGFSSTPESDQFQSFHSSQIQGQGDNRVSYNSPEMDRALEKARVTVDRDERMKGWHAVHRILHEDQPYTFLVSRKMLMLANKRIKNIKPATIGINYEPLNGGMIPWYVPKALQKHSN
jgi:peptide/nickel transport system substrate-binding protein